MKTLKTLSLLALTLFVSVAAEARVISIVGRGEGGTTTGDRDAACGRAYDRARDDGFGQCSAQRGLVVTESTGSCHCRKKEGSKDDYNCEATQYIECETRSRWGFDVVGSGSGGTTTGDKDAACQRAYDRATDDAYTKCGQQNAHVESSSQGACHCQKQGNSKDDYNCNATVQATCSRW